MTRMKKLISIVLTAVLLSTSFAAISFASENNNIQDTNEIQLQVILCANCQRREMVMRPVSYSYWYTLDHISCTHNVSHPYRCWDEVQERTVTFNYVCNFCGAPSPLTISSEQRVVHQDS